MFKKIISLSLCISLVLSSVSLQYANENQGKDEVTDNVIIESTINDDADNDDSSDKLVIATFSDAEDGDTQKEKELNESEDDITASTSSEANDITDDKEPIKDDEASSDNDGENSAVATKNEVENPDEVSSTTKDDSELVATESDLAIEATASQISLATESELIETNINEYLHGYTGKGILQKKKGFKPQSLDDDLYGTDDLPAVYDARTIMNPNNPSMPISPQVRNQSYQDCWAHATIGLIEASIRKKGLVTTEEESNLSEAALIYNTYHLENITNGSSNMDKPGVEGNDYVARSGDFVSSGDPIESLIMASSYMGFVTENEDTKYEKMSSMINNGLDGKYAFNSNSFVLANAETIPSFGSESDRNNMKRAIRDYGAIQLPLNCDPTANNSHEHNGEWYYYSDDGARIDHALVAVGWNDNIPKEYFVNTQGHSPANNGGWLCKNSWGTNAPYHNGGYFWLSYFDGGLGSLYISADVIKADTYKYNYHYDTTTYYNYMSPADIYGGGSMGNVFKVSSDVDQTLDAISVAMAVYTGYKFNIEIYTKDSAMTNPTDGTLKHTQSFDSQGKTGVFTIPLTQRVPLSKGSYYSIALKCEPNSGISIYLDETHTNGSTKYYNAAQLGQSFMKSSSTEDWADINDGQLQTINGKTYGKNLRIKGLANPVGTPDPDPDPDPTPDPTPTPTPTPDPTPTPTPDPTPTPTPTPDPTPTPTPTPTKTVSSISVSSMPKKIEYTTGEIFDANGLVLTLKYSDNTTENRAYSNANKNDFRFNGLASLMLNNKSDQFKITISYVGKTCSINVKVSAPNKQSSDNSSSSSSSSSSSDYVGGPATQNRTTAAPSNNKISQSFVSVPVNFNTQGSAWNKNANGTWQLTFKNNLGQQVQAKNMWININTQSIVNGQQTVVSDYYYFDNTGNMLTGWLADSDNKKRYLETANTADIGKMIRGWKQISGSYYYFDMNGFLLTGGVTPDGYRVDANGVWVNR